MEQLRPGNRIVGPALIESEHTTVVLPPGTVYTVDQYMNGLIEKVGSQTKGTGEAAVYSMEGGE